MVIRCFWRNKLLRRNWLKTWHLNLRSRRTSDIPEIPRRNPEKSVENIPEKLPNAPNGQVLFGHSLWIRGNLFRACAKGTPELDKGEVTFTFWILKLAGVFITSVEFWEKIWSSSRAIQSLKLGGYLPWNQTSLVWSLVCTQIGWKSSFNQNKKNRDSRVLLIGGRDYVRY